MAAAGQGNGRRVVLCGNRADGSKYSKHIIYPDIVIDAASLSGVHLCMEVGTQVMIAALKYLQQRKTPRPRVPEPLTVFVIRILQINKASAQSFPRQTCMDSSVYKTIQMFRLCETGKVSFPATTAANGTIQWKKKVGQPLRLVRRQADGSYTLVDLRDQSMQSKQDWYNTLVSKLSAEARLVASLTPSYGSVISFQSSYFTDEWFQVREADIYGYGNTTPAMRLCTGLTAGEVQAEMGFMWWAIMPQGPSPHKQQPRADFVAGEVQRPVVTIPVQLLHDINCNLLPIERIGHREGVHCLVCDYTGPNGAPDRNVSAITSVRDDGSGSVGYWCFNCNKSNGIQGVMYWMDNAIQVIKPIEGTRPFRSFRYAATEYLSDVVSPEEVLSTRICGIAAQTGAGKSFFWRELVLSMDAMPTWQPTLFRTPQPGEVFKIDGKTPWIVILHRRSLAENFHSVMKDLGELLRSQNKTDR